MTTGDRKPSANHLETVQDSGASILQQNIATPIFRWRWQSQRPQEQSHSNHVRAL
ncbi:hypothetical protein C1H46_016267 [Malus baccata]|uniref:Uncharacterized protein n=1 Tax=Malus baccata TaxID=106549 RepID=A0A540MHB1_MALBA|nr:hypothetical protein C1H46_016267 [Malus baccata]